MVYQLRRKLFYLIQLYLINTVYSIDKRVLSEFTKVDHPKPLALHSSVIINNLLILHGGILSSTNIDSIYQAQPLSDTWVFDFESNNWYKLNKKYKGLKFHQAAAIGQTMYIYTAASDMDNTLISLDTNKWKWDEVSRSNDPNLLYPHRIGATMVSAKDSLILYGGTVPNGTESDKSFHMYVFDTVKSQWAVKPDGNEVSFHSACYYDKKGAILFYGGKSLNISTDSTFFATFANEDPTQDPTFKLNPPNHEPTPGHRIAATLSCVGDLAVLIGGGDDTWKPVQLSVFTLNLTNWSLSSEINWKRVKLENSISGPSGIVGHSASVNDKDIYIYGGIGINKTSIYKLNTENWSWSTIEPNNKDNSNKSDSNDDDSSSNNDNNSNSTSNTTIIIAIISALFGVLMMGVIIGVLLRYWRRKNRKLPKETPSLTINNNQPMNNETPSSIWRDSNTQTPGRHSQYSGYHSNSPSFSHPFSSPLKANSESKLISTPKEVSQSVTRIEEPSDKHDLNKVGSYSILSGNDDGLSSIVPSTIQYMRPLSPLDSNRSEKFNEEGTSQFTRETNLDPSSPLFVPFQYKSIPRNFTAPSLTIDTGLVRNTISRQNEERMSPLERISRLGHNVDHINSLSRSPDGLSTPSSSIQNWPYREDNTIGRIHIQNREIPEADKIFSTIASSSSNANNNGLESILMRKLGKEYRLTSSITNLNSELYSTTVTELVSSTALTVLLYSNQVTWEKELDMLQILEGPYVPHVKMSFILDETQKPYYGILQSSCGLGLIDVLRKQKYPLSDDELRGIIKQTTQLLSFCHSRGVVISDLQPMDLSFSGDSVSNRIMLTRMGRCLIEGDTITYKNLRYYAPEIATLLHSGKGWLGADPKLDMWALGCLIYELYARKPYLGNISESEILEFLSSKGKISLSNGIHFDSDGVLNLIGLDGLPIEASEAIRMLLNINPFKRATAMEVLDSEFLVQTPSQLSFSPNRSLENLYQFYGNLTTEMKNLINGLRKQVIATSEVHVPRLMVLLPTIKTGDHWQDPDRWTSNTFRLHFLCEAEPGLHFINHPGFEVPSPHEFIAVTGPLLTVVAQLCALLLDAEKLMNAHPDILQSIQIYGCSNIVEYFETISKLTESYCMSSQLVDSTISKPMQELYYIRNSLEENSNWLVEWIAKAREMLLSNRHLALKEIRQFLYFNGSFEDDLLGLHWIRSNSIENQPNLNSKWSAWVCDQQIH